ncbi:ABC transporter substrate-binding protein [Actinotalea sp. C106]|uniref:ABC transporter substrate-binding protein n=1 Tax=Actinotalea sp. C106 TaxID=2908644 RepID=UPI002028174F|nr:ABC transporter substrate-binding protein [Actinotalea sp. C106]
MKWNDRSRAISTLAMAAGAALVLSGCGGASAEPASSGDERIRVAFMQPPKAAMNPFSDDAFKLSRLSSAETLVRVSDDVEPEGLLARSWEQVGELTWVFALRDDVTFHDGETFDAEAVKNAFDRAGEAVPPPRALSGVNLTTEVTGEGEVTVTTDVPDAMLPNRLASPQLSIFSPSAYGDGGSVSPIGTGTGPFELTEVDGSSTLTLERFEDYWGDVAIASGIDASFVPDGTARAAAIRAAEADVAETVPISQVSLLDEEAVNEVFMPRTTSVALNTASGPFEDPAVRAAARAAIDPGVIAETIYEGYADPAVGLLGPAVPWAADLRGDTASAVEPAQVDGVEITLATYTDRAENPEIAVQIEAQLESAGFVVTQDVREYANLELEMLGGAFDAVVVSRNTMLDTGDPLSAFAQDFGCEGGNNIAQLCDPAVDEILEEGLQFPAGPERQEATMAVEAAVLRLDAAIPLVHERVVQGELGTFSGFERDPLERRLITEYTAPVD